MKITVHRSNVLSGYFSRTNVVWFSAAVVVWLAMTLRAWTQMAPPGVPVGPTLAASVRSAAAATRDQADMVAITAKTCARNASSANYRIDQFVADFRMMQLQFHAVRERFNWMGNLALQLNRPQANNVLAELDAGLNIISELFVFLDERFTAGTLDRATHVRICRTLEDVMREWERELQRSIRRMGIAA